MLNLDLTLTALSYLAVHSFPFFRRCIHSLDYVQD